METKRIEFIIKDLLELIKLFSSNIDLYQTESSSHLYEMKLPFEKFIDDNGYSCEEIFHAFKNLDDETSEWISYSKNGKKIKQIAPFSTGVKFNHKELLIEFEIRDYWLRKIIKGDLIIDYQKLTEFKPNFIIEI